jgi:DNA-binding NarL/FixJ family response regulator
MSEQRVRVGVAAADPLLSLGLIGILEESLPVEALALSAGELLAARGDAGGVTVVILALGPSAGLPAVPPVHEPAAVTEALCATVARLRRQWPALKIVVVGGPLSAAEIQQLVRAGAKGYLQESATEAEVRMALDVVLDGSIWAPRKVLARLIDETAADGTASGPAADAPLEELSAREQEVMELLMNGRSNREIAAALGIEPATVKAHLGRMLRKTRSRNRLEMTLRSMARAEAQAEALTDAPPEPPTHAPPPAQLDADLPPSPTPGPSLRGHQAHPTRP